MLINKLLNIYMDKAEGVEGGGGGDEKPAPKQEQQKPEQKPDEQKPEQKPEEQKPAEQKPQEDNLPPKSEDKSKLGQVTSLVEQAGLDMKAVAEIAKANDGQVDLETMVALKEQHGEAIASLIADQIKGIHKERTEAASKRDQEVYDQVKEAFKDVTDQSGEETWKELSGWAKENVSNEHRKEINEMLAQGGLAAKLAVQEMVSAFKESQGTQEYQEADLINGDKTPTGGGGDISKAEYNMELDKLVKAGHRYGESQEIRKLQVRRQRSMQRGIN